MCRGGTIWYCAGLEGIPLEKVFRPQRRDFKQASFLTDMLVRIRPPALLLYTFEIIDKMDIITLVGSLAIITGILRLAPQIIKTVKTKKVRDISLVWEIFGALNAALGLHMVIYVQIQYYLLEQL